MASKFSAIQNMAMADLLAQVKVASVDDALLVAFLLCGMTGWLFRGILWDKPNPFRHVLFQRPQLSTSDGITDFKQNTRNIAEKLAENESDVVIFWGSQSGTAEGFANRLAKECHSRYNIGAFVADLSDYDVESIELLPQGRLAIFLLSTYGEGDPPDNAQSLWDWVKSSNTPSLNNLQYAAFGLGNSNYKHYNRVVDCVSAFLSKCGAKELYPTGRADDSKGSTEEDFIMWKTSLFRDLVQQLGWTEREVKYESALLIVEDESLPVANLHLGEPIASFASKGTASASSSMRPTSVKDGMDLYSSSDRCCLHMELDISTHPELNYKTGDHLGVTPINPDIEVNILLKSLGIYERRNKPISISSTSSDVKLKLPSPTTIDAIFRYYLEICGPVSRETLCGLVEFAPNAAARTLVSTMGQDKEAYAEFQRANSLNIGRILQIATQGKEPWKALPLSFLIESIPLLRPRYYSISSSSIVQPRQPAITVAVSKVHLKDGHNGYVQGLSTNYLVAVKNSLNSSTSPHLHNLSYALGGPSETLAGGKLNIHIRKSRFKLPLLPAKPIIMISAGTGIAPFRGFLQERARLKVLGRQVGRTILFFGCRNEDDYLYKEELAVLQDQLGHDTCTIVTAFSRSANEKVYVQQRLKENAEELHSLLRRENANLYICGSAKMAREAGQILEHELVNKFGWTEEEFRTVRHQKGRWQEDVWG